MSLKEQILSSDDLPREAVRVPEWCGEPLYVRTLTAADRDAFDDSVRAGGANMDKFRAKLVVATLVDSAGAAVFTADDVDAVGAKSSVAVGRIFDAAIRLNAMGKEDVEAMTEGFTTTQAASSAST